MKDSSNPPEEQSSELQKMEWRDLEQGRRPTYAEIKKKFSPDKLKARAGFVLSELVASQLSVEEDERQRFEKKVGEELQNRLNVLKSEAYQKGFAQGEEDGRKKAMDEEKARLAALMEKMSLAAKDLSEAKQNLANQYEITLVDLAFRVSEVILHSKIDEKPEIVRFTIRSILERISREDDIRVRLSSHSFEGISTIQEDLKALTRDGRITFELDAQLPKGACIVESQSGEFASFIDDKVSVLKNEINQRLKDEMAQREEDKKKVG